MPPKAPKDPQIHSSKQITTQTVPPKAPNPTDAHDARFHFARNPADAHDARFWWGLVAYALRFVGPVHGLIAPQPFSMFTGCSDMPDKLTNARKGKGEFGLFGKLSGGGRFFAFVFGSPSGRCFVAHFFFHLLSTFGDCPGTSISRVFSTFFGACEKRAPSAPHPLVGENPHPQMLHDGYSRKPGLMVMMLRTQQTLGLTPTTCHKYGLFRPRTPIDVGKQA